MLKLTQAQRATIKESRREARIAFARDQARVRGREWIPDDEYRATKAKEAALEAERREQEKADRTKLELADARDAREPELRDRIRKYGLRVPEYHAMRDEQKNNCAACGEAETEKDKFVVDHNHTTGRVRGLIHASCNSVVGFAHESPHRCKAIAAYLERHLVSELIS